MFSLLYRNCIVACLCWVGWLEVYGMIVSVNIGFLHMAILRFVWVLLMVMYRKFIWLFSSHCAVNLSFGCIVLKSFSTFCMSEWFVVYDQYVILIIY